LRSLEEVDRDVEKLMTDTYYGKGRSDPSLTTRMAAVEASLERLSSNLSKIAWLVVGTLTTVIGEIVVALIRKGF
jgi:hypothetical protein